VPVAEPNSEFVLVPSVGRRVGRGHALFLLLAIAAVTFVRAKWFSGDSRASPVVEVPPRSPNIASPSTAPEKAAMPASPTLIGSWGDHYYGERTMTFRADGTGTMVIKLDSVGQAIYGEKLLFELDWENRDGVLVMEFTGGEPKAAVESISKLWGTKHEQKIEQLSDSELYLRSADSQNLYKLKRLADGE
jgi:hypothetical protein